MLLKILSRLSQQEPHLIRIVCHFGQESAAKGIVFERAVALLRCLRCRELLFLPPLINIGLEEEERGKDPKEDEVDNNKTEAMILGKFDAGVAEFCRPDCRVEVDVVEFVR